MRISHFVQFQYAEFANFCAVILGLGGDVVPELLLVEPGLLVLPPLLLLLLPLQVTHPLLHTHTQTQFSIPWE